ncbi:TIR domain-containing protein [Acidithiobacillus sp.]
MKQAVNSENEDDIKQKIRERINRTPVTAVHLTPDSAKSKWVEWEITESLKHGKGVGVPLVTCPARPSCFGNFDYSFISIILPSMMLFETPWRLP